MIFFEVIDNWILKNCEQQEAYVGAEPSQAEPSFSLLKPSQTKLWFYWEIFDYFQLTYLKNKSF